MYIFILVVILVALVTMLTSTVLYGLRSRLPKGITIDHSRSIEELIKKGDYDWVAPSINSNEFIASRKVKRSKKDVEKYEVRVFHFNYNICSESAIRKMRQTGWSPATLEQLLAYSTAIAANSEPREFQIVALGSSCEFPEEGCYAPVFKFNNKWWSEKQRILELRRWRGGWNAGYGYSLLAVRRIR